MFDKFLGNLESGVKAYLEIRQKITINESTEKFLEQKTILRRKESTP